MSSVLCTVLPKYQQTDRMLPSSPRAAASGQTKPTNTHRKHKQLFDE